MAETMHVIGKFVNQQGEKMSQELMSQMDLHPIIYRGQRCVTYEWIDQIHERPDGAAKKAFSRNAEKFTEGKHYFKVPYVEAVQGLYDSPLNGPSENGGYRGPRMLFTEKGYCLLIKTFGDDRAWTIQEELIDGYFRKQADGDLTPEDSKTEAERLLAISERTTAAFRLLVQQEKDLRCLQVQQLSLKAKQDQMEAKHEETKVQVQGLLAVQQKAMEESTQLDLCPNPAMPKETRAKVAEIVESYALRTTTELHGDFRSAYGRLYREFERRYHIDLPARKRNSKKKESCLDIAEKMGWHDDCQDLVINALWALATELFGPVPNDKVSNSN